MKYTLLTLFSLALCGCSSAQRGSVASGFGEGLWNGITQPLAESAGDATFGPYVFVGALTALIGLVVAWIFNERLAGLGMALSGLALGGAAVALQEAMTTILIGSGCLFAVCLVLWFTNEAWRKRMRKHAAALFGQDRPAEAVEVERNASRELDKELKRKEKGKKP